MLEIKLQAQTAAMMAAIHGCWGRQTPWLMMMAFRITTNDICGSPFLLRQVVSASLPWRPRVRTGAIGGGCGIGRIGKKP